MGAKGSTDHREPFENEETLPNLEKYCQNWTREILKISVKFRYGAMLLMTKIFMDFLMIS